MFFLLFKLIRKLIYGFITFYFAFLFFQFFTFQTSNYGENVYFVLIFLGVATLLGLRFLLHRKKKIPYFKRTIGYLTILYTLYVVYDWLLSGNHYPEIITTVVRDFQLDTIFKTLDFNYSFYGDFNQAIMIPSIIILAINIILPFIRGRKHK